MAHIFLSHASADRELAHRLADTLEHRGHTVWWDHHLLATADFEGQISGHLEQAQVVIVIWSCAAATSNWVYSEANAGAKADKLINTRVPDFAFASIPRPYDIWHTHDVGDHDKIFCSIDALLAGTRRLTTASLAELYESDYERSILESRQEPLPSNVQEMSPSALLQARYEVVPYIDVGDARQNQLTWCRDYPRPIAGRLIHAPGGIGKSRLLAEVTRELRRDGWVAGFLEHAHVLEEPMLKRRDRALEQLFELGDHKGVCVVVDYAEARRKEVVSLSSMLARLQERASRPIRLVLIARTAGEWWRMLHAQERDIQFVFRRDARNADIVELGSFDSPDERLQFFKDSLAVLQPLLAVQGYSLPAHEPTPERLDRICTNRHLTRPLAIQMEAMLCIAARAATPSLTMDEMLDRFLGLERAHWHKLLGPLDDDQERDLLRAVVQVSLVSGVSTRTATGELLAADKFFGETARAPALVDSMLRSLTRILGRAEGGVAGIEPDLLAEHTIVSIADRHLVSSIVQWAESQPEPTRWPAYESFIRVLQRASQPEHGLTASNHVISLFEHLLTQNTELFAWDVVQVMTDTPGVLRSVLERVLDDISPLGIHELDVSIGNANVPLMDLAVRVSERQLAIREAAIHGPEVGPAQEFPEGAASEVRMRLGIRHSALGHDHQALAHVERAADELRRLLPANPAVYRRVLASCLHVLGTLLGRLGHREKSLPVYKEAITLFQGLVTEGNKELRVELAMAFNNLGITYTELGEARLGIVLCTLAAKALHEIEDEGCTKYLSELAQCESGLGGMCLAFGDYDAALSFTEDAIELLTRLADLRAGHYAHQLIAAWVNLGCVHGACERLEDALNATRSALDIARRMAESQPEVFLGDIGACLKNKAAQLGNLGKLEEGFTTACEAIDLFTSLAQTRPEKYSADLAFCTVNAIGFLQRMDRWEEAQVYADKGVTLYRSLVQMQAVAHDAQLAAALIGVGDIHTHFNRDAQAVEAYTESAGLLRRLARACPQIHDPALINVQNKLALALLAVERSHEALQAAEEGLAICRAANTKTKDDSSKLGMCLKTMARVLGQMRRWLEAVKFGEEIIALYRQHASEEPERCGPILGISLVEHSALLSAAKMREASIKVAREAVERLRPAAVAYPVHGPRELAGALFRLAEELICADQRREATELEREALALLQGIGRPTVNWSA